MVEITKHYLISGRVQGVGFRAFTLRTAQQLGVRGWVRNLPDGRVEALGQASEEVLNLFTTQLKLGPAHGQVDSLIVTDRPTERRCEGFSIRKDDR